MKAINKEEINYPKIGSKYRHYKGGTYKVITLGNSTIDNSPQVVYTSLEFGSTYVRPLEDWNSKTANGTTRFYLIT